jgi:hypothetical protein
MREDLLFCCWWSKCVEGDKSAVNQVRQVQEQQLLDAAIMELADVELGEYTVCVKRRVSILHRVFDLHLG